MINKSDARAEAETLDAQRACGLLTEHSPLPLAAVTGPDHVVQYANPAFCHFLNKEYEALVGFPFAQVLPEAKDYLASLDRVRQTGEPEFGAEGRQSLQHTGYWAYGLWAIMNAQQQPIGVMIHLFESPESATLRERAVAMNEQLMVTAVRQHELNEEHINLLYSVLNNVPMAIYFKDLEGQFTRINRHAELTMGISSANALGKTAGEIFPAEIARPIERSDRLAIEGAIPVHQEEMLRLQDGEHWFLTYKFPRRNAAGNVVGLCGMSMEITERKRMEQQLEHAKEAAEVANSAKDQFLAVLSRELRTPLTPVLSAVTMLQRSPKVDPETRNILNTIRRNVEMEARLIDDLLDLTHIVRGKMKIEKRPVELTEIIRTAVEVCEANIHERGLEFSLDAPSGPFLIAADETRLRQVFWNLLQNAVRFTPRGGRVAIQCRRSGDDSCVTIEVSDTGCGIAPEVLPRLFRPFEQRGPHATQQPAGLGLGLAISKALVEQHEGTIEARSPGDGKGASFTISLPLLANTAAPYTQSEYLL